MNPILDKIIWLVEYNEVISHRQLELHLIADFPEISNGKILEFISTAAQDGLVKRIEYTMGSFYSYKYFYLPVTAKLT